MLLPNSTFSGLMSLQVVQHRCSQGADPMHNHRSQVLQGSTAICRNCKALASAAHKNLPAQVLSMQRWML
jgi:hypothetical protein